MRTTIGQLMEMKRKGEKFCMLTAYDYPTARFVDHAGVPLILVGDSLGMVLLGYESTIPVTMEEMIHHTRAVSKGTRNALVVGDMPFMTYHTSIEDALRNAARFLQDGGAQAVKLEGGETVAEKVRHIIASGIPVMGHLGYTPQSTYQLGGPRAVGKSPEAARQLLQDARALDEAGVFSIVLELVPAPLAKLVTGKISVPTIGIGAGRDCDGQVQVINDLLGLSADFVPKHAKQYARLADIIKSAIAEYKAEVTAGSFPAPEHSPTMDEGILAEL
ncbi:MAG: 3-methyl-2-oxobutanoate hydroxymethyltransferase [Dehalococcoidia bacterium]|nr:3-methyl-2-oxobutanoate hydroxymethyltransferase [Chloroflexota bacterium]MBT9161925.1 3-methyl-2-oxobutanoate hydroxymethyltransferase [Chloroflexota bacterium]